MEILYDPGEESDVVYLRFSVKDETLSVYQILLREREHTNESGKKIIDNFFVELRNQRHYNS